MTSTPKRPRDTNQLAKMVVDIATEGGSEEPQIETARAVSGAKGGSARARQLTPEERAEGARLAAQARWRRKTD